MEKVTTEDADAAPKDYFLTSFYGNWFMLGGSLIAAVCAKALGGMILMGLVIGCLLVFMAGCDTIVKATNKKETKE